ncbi:hypothetical protein G6F68_011794 [Rhizopus microsporus]|nr:hypothetical protein G6F68_011794 [Rhizopus microsporus]
MWAMPRAAGQIIGQTDGVIRTRIDAEELRQRRPQVAPTEDLAVGQVEVFVPGLRVLRGPDARITDETHIHGFARIGNMPGIPERLAFGAAHRRIDTDDRHGIHGHAHVGADHDSRTEYRPAEAAPRGGFANVVFLEPVRVRMVVPGMALARGNADGVQVHAIGLGALQHRDMAQPTAAGQRLDHVPDHGQVGGHLLWILPARNEARLFIDGRIEDMGDLRQGLEGATAGLGVLQVYLQMGERPLADDLRPPPGDGDDFPAGVQEGVDGRGAHQPAGPSDDNGARHDCLSPSQG